MRKWRLSENWRTYLGTGKALPTAEGAPRVVVVPAGLLPPAVPFVHGVREKLIADRRSRREGRR
jgi:hypothetical protein